MSDTTDFLSRSGLIAGYETSLREWRLALQSRSGDQEEILRIREDLTGLRRELRLQGYDLSLGSRDLVLQGFRNDSCLAEGFRRAVIFITDRDVVFLSGSANHLELARYLESKAVGRYGVIRQRHYLWYRWVRTQLILSGSDTKTPEDWEVLKTFAESHKNYLLSKLKNL